VLGEGDTAPTFELRGTHEGEIDTHRLTDSLDRGTNVLLSFHAFDFNPVCTAETCSLLDAEFFTFRDDLAVLGVSGDGVYSRRQFAAQEAINYPLLSDTDGSVAEAYGALADEFEGTKRVPRRSSFLIDTDRTVALSAAVDADGPDDIGLTPLNDAITEFYRRRDSDEGMA
jgi:peroxiredoxin